jgi:hypothetical protein
MENTGHADATHQLWTETFSPGQRQQMAVDDHFAWRNVVSVLIAVVSTGTAMMALAVLACL